jgi:hypothetical protein
MERASKTVAQWHASPPCEGPDGKETFYFRPGTPTDSIKAELRHGLRGAVQIAVGSPRFEGKVAFTALVHVLSEPARFDNDEKNPETVNITSPELFQWINSIAAKVNEVVGTAATYKDPYKRDLFGETFIRAKLFPRTVMSMRWFNKAGERVESFPLQDRQMYIMAMLKPYLMNGTWGLTVNIYQFQEA